MSARLLVAHDVAEMPRLWPDSRRQELAEVVDEVVRGAKPALDVLSPLSGMQVVPVPGNHRLYFQPPNPTLSPAGSGVPRRPEPFRFFALAPAPQNELLVRPGVAGTAARPLATLSEAELNRLGVPRDLVPAIRNAPSLESLGKLLPEPVLMRLRTCCVAAAPAAINFIPEVLKYEVPDLETLRQFYLGDIKRLLLNLEPQQRELVDLVPRRPILVKGVAGSGKTTVAVYRARRLLTATPGRQPRVLVLSFTKALTQAAAEMLKDLCGREVPDLHVQTVHAWCFGYLDSRRRRPTLTDEKLHQREAALADALTLVRKATTSAVLERPRDFWLEEFSEVIKGRCRARWDEYRSVERVGRGDGLRLQGREIVWRVFEAYQRNLARIGRLDWDDVVLAALEVLEKDTAFEPYDYVFVDEAQDLSVAALKLVAKLAREPAGLFLMADGRQSIYQKGFRWKDVGLEIRGSVHTLKRNFRSTVEIAAAADNLRTPEIDAEDDGEVHPPVRHGPRPKLVPCSDESAECKFVVSRIARLLRENAAAPANIAVLARSVALLKSVRDALASEAVPHRMHKEGQLALGDPTVKLLTLHSAKGLEFPMVFIVGVDHGIIPEELNIDDPAEREAHVLRERRLLYVGMTRAIQDLTLVYDRSRPSSFITELDQSLFEQAEITLPSETKLADHDSRRRPACAPAASNPTPAGDMTIVEKMKGLGIQFKDNRASGGALWIVASEAAARFVKELEESGVRLNYKKEGGRATGRRPGWWTTDKR